MSDSTTISARLKAAAQGPAWHGPAVLEILKGLDVEQARCHPVQGAHSIWQIVRHINAWQNYTLAILQGHDVKTLEGTHDWPIIPAQADHKDWETAVRMFQAVGKELSETIEILDDQKLHETVPNKDFNIKILLHGLIDHNLYHCGQIALLRKCIHNLSPNEMRLAVGE